MTDLEKRRQAIADAHEITRYTILNLRPKLVKEIRKFNIFPRILKSTYTTKNKNKYFLLFLIESRSDIDKPYIMASYTIMDSAEGKYAMSAVLTLGENVSFQIYSPHLFARYTQRYGCNMYEEERIHRFMEDSLKSKYTGTREYEEGKIYSVVNGGAILGDIRGDIIVYKTYVDDESLREEQLELGDEISESFVKRNNLYKNLFKKRKRV